VSSAEYRRATRYGVRRPGGGVVTSVNGEPIVTREEAERALDAMWRFAGERGVIVRVAAVPIADWEALGRAREDIRGALAVGENATEGGQLEAADRE
jgi:hypothetical protein